jgi:GMP synthase-like glutamine amidotransferase
MHIGILEPGVTPDDLIDAHGTMPEMAERLLGALDPSLRFSTWRVVDGVFPDSVTATDAWLVMGSKHGVYEDLPWMRALKEFLRGAIARDVPVVGICFGHQILAEAMGGKVVKSERGWGCGVHRYSLSDGGEIAVAAMHQDQVIEVPPGARVIATSEFCPVAGLDYDGRAMSFQPHPEFEDGFIRDLVASRRGGSIPVPVADVALESIEEVDDASLGRRIIDFFRSRQIARRAA